MNKHLLNVALITGLALCTSYAVGMSDDAVPLVVPVLVDEKSYPIEFTLHDGWEIAHKDRVAEFLRSWLPTTPLVGHLRTIAQLSKKRNSMCALLKKKHLSPRRRGQIVLLLTGDAETLREPNKATGSLHKHNDEDLIRALHAEAEGLSERIAKMQKSTEVVMATQLRLALLRLKVEESEEAIANRESAQSEEAIVSRESTQDDDGEELIFPLEL